jgi:hypothetical protein
MAKQKQHEYTFEIYNGRIKIKVDGFIMLTFNQIDFLGFYSFKDDESLFGITFHFLREGAGSHSFDFYAKTKEHWLAVLKLLDENM